MVSEHGDSDDRQDSGGYGGRYDRNPAPRRSADEKARLDAALTDLIKHRVSFNPVLGLTVQALAPQRVLGFEMRPELVGHFNGCTTKTAC